MNSTLKIVLVILTMFLANPSFATKVRDESAKVDDSRVPVKLYSWESIREKSPHARHAYPEDAMKFNDKQWDCPRDIPAAVIQKVRCFLLYSPSEQRFYIVTHGGARYYQEPVSGIMSVQRETDESRSSRISRRSNLFHNDGETSRFLLTHSWDVDGTRIVALNVSNTGIASVPQSPNVAQTPQQEGGGHMATVNKDCSRVSGLERIACEAEKNLGNLGSIIPRR
jgi:hypothetical protein